MATISFDYDITPAHQTRVLAAYQVEANADLNGTASPAQVLLYIRKVLKQVVIDHTKQYETTVAEAAADAGITPVVMT